EAGAVDVRGDIQPRETVIAAGRLNLASFAGFIAKLDLSLKAGNKGGVVTDTSWVSSDREAPGWEKPGFSAAGWTPARSFGKLGAQPWGDVMAGAIVKGAGASKQATPAESLATLPGFRIELLRSAQPGEGSWVSMAVDNKGRLILDRKSTRLNSSHLV